MRRRVILCRMAESPLIDAAAEKVMAQVPCTYNEAREHMRAYRAASGKTLVEVAEAVIDRSLRFDGGRPSETAVSR